MNSIKYPPPNHPSNKTKTGDQGNNSNRDPGFDQVSNHLDNAPSADGNLQMGEVNPDNLEQIFVQRSALIAKPIEEGEKGEQVEMALFRIGNETYGLDVQSILDIQPRTIITPLPRVPKWITGMTNIGGHILPVLDLQSFLGLAISTDQASAAPSGFYLIRICSQDLEWALKVDEVLSIELLPTSKIQATMDVTRGLPPEYVQGVFMRNSGESSLVLILNLANLLADPRLIIQEEIV